MGRSETTSWPPTGGEGPAPRRQPALDPARPAEPDVPPDPDATARHAQAEAEAAWLNGKGTCGDPGDREAGRHRLIAETAYFKAERRGFAPGGAIDDWLEAEREVEAALGLDL